MKRFRACVVLGMLVSGAMVATADTVHFNYISGGNGSYSAFGGGIPSGSRGGSFNVTAQNHGTFNTFCIEVDENIGFSTYNYSVSSSAVDGGSGGPSPDPLDSRTAFLFHHYSIGDLGSIVSGYNGNAASIDALQYAIWVIEQELAPAGGAQGLAGSLVSAANLAVANGLWSGIGDVRVMNVFDSQGRNAQDQLILVPAPAAWFLGMLGTVLVGSVVRRTG